ncbi:MAG: PAS domain-containing protein [Flavobacterium sp.]|nr:MAG: PAS domain-containing protein [Flavobacterium sp.]
MKDSNKKTAIENPETPAYVDNPKLSQFPIIGLGGSAGSFYSFEKFFGQMPVDSGFAFVVIMHLDSTVNVNIVSILQQYTTMPVIEVKDGCELFPNHVFVIPSNTDMAVHDGHLLLFNTDKRRKINMAIDYFLQSLANDQWNKAVAIIFSGMGTDGETGVRMIKEKLGMAMVQDPDTAEYPSMPTAAIKTGLIDYILPPEQMPKKLVQYLNHPALQQNSLDNELTETNNSIQLRKILVLLRSHTGHDFTLYKRNTISRRVERRIAFHQLTDYTSYLNYIEENPFELDTLFKELLIGVTKFFRDHKAFEALKTHLYTRLSQKNIDEPVRVWIAGCSTGEEAYSIAMYLMEYLDTLPITKRPVIQLFATDLDARAIEDARTGFYFSNIVSEVSPSRITRFFVKKNNGYVVKKELRELVVFARHNLIKDAPFTRLDLLCCRNVLIYFSTDLQKKLLPVFHYSLNTKGLLFLGPAESVGGYSEAFSQINPKWKIFDKLDGTSTLTKMIDFPFNVNSQTPSNLKETSQYSMSKSKLADNFHKLLLDQYTPASLLVNEKGDILYINGDMANYLQFNSGEAVMNVHKMAREELRYPLSNAIHQVFSQKKNLDFAEFKIKVGRKVHVVAFSLDYVKSGQLQGLLLITFRDNGEIKKVNKKLIPFSDSQDRTAYFDLEKELVYTKQQLHTTIEQMETSLEELKSTNEELQSTNEELQSTNEESLTTKEEMQSLNEELMTINLQYHTKAEELTRLNNDMKNLLDNTEIGTIFLDNQLNILRYTPQVTKLFNIIPSDVGRSITHVVSNFDYPATELAISKVIESLIGKELEVKTKKNDWYNLRIMPYRTLDNFINGAVLTFTKITPLKSLENKLAALTKYSQEVVNSLDSAAVLLDKDKKVLVVNPAFLTLFKLTENEIKEQFFMEFVMNRWKIKKLENLFTSAEDEMYIEHDFQDIGLLRLKVSIHYASQSKTDEQAAITVTFKEQGNEEKIPK